MKFGRLLVAALAVAVLAVPAYAGNCQVGMSFQQLQYYQPLPTPVEVVPQQNLQVPLTQLQVVPQYQQPQAVLQVQQSQSYYQQQQFQNFQLRQRAQYQPPVVVQNFQVRQRVQQPPPVVVQNFVQQPQRQQFRQRQNFAANGGGADVRIRPTGLARLLGVGGPDIQISGGGQQVSARPTGLARLFGTGGQIVNVR